MPCSTGLGNLICFEWIDQCTFRPLQIFPSDPVWTYSAVWIPIGTKEEPPALGLLVWRWERWLERGVERDRSLGSLVKQTFPPSKAGPSFPFHSLSVLRLLTPAAQGGPYTPPRVLQPSQGPLLSALTFVNSPFIKRLKLLSVVRHLFPAGPSLVHALICKAV